MSEHDTSFSYHLQKWNLTPDGTPIITHSSHLLPVIYNGLPAMLKIADAPEEKAGGQLMVWWNGSGAAKVLMYDSAALLLERATGTVSLKTMAQQSATGDDEATRILCRAVRKIHIPSSRSLPDLVPLKRWFRDLGPMANQHGGILTHCGKAANDLLNEPQDEVPLHGDIHHENVLDFGERGWLVIDPKGLYGERGFDYANLFCNPDEETAILPGRLARQVELVAAEAGLERQRLLRWILAWAGLSAAWSREDNLPAETTLRVAETAAAALRA